MRLAPRQAFTKKLRQQKRLATRNGYSSRGLVVEDDVPLYLRHDIINAHLPSYELPCAGRTLFDTLPTEGAFGDVRNGPAVHLRHRPAFADFDARAAPDAPVGLHAVFRTGRPALRIVTPQALQRTALEEHRRADTGTIVNGVSLYIEYDALGRSAGLERRAFLFPLVRYPGQHSLPLKHPQRRTPLAWTHHLTSLLGQPSQLTMKL